MEKKIENLMDERQKNLHTNFPQSHYLSDPTHIKRLLDWMTFYRRNIARFVQHYFGITLHLYQYIILSLMSVFPSICIVAARSSAKSFLIAIYACAECILRPGSKVVIASATKKQARLIVSEKIKKELVPVSPLLAAEISGFKDNQNDVEVTFHNTSSIVVVVGNENARGYRATILIYEEFRMIAKKVIDSVLSPFLVVRQAPFLFLDEYSKMVEEPKEIYISSAWYKSHWMWTLMKSFVTEMFTKKTACVLAMDYSIVLRHGIKTRNYLIKERKKLDPISWAIEYENTMISENKHAYFSYEMLNNNRVTKRAFYPRQDMDVVSRTKNKYAIPKQAGEIRIISCDIAMETKETSDNSVISCIRLLPESREYKSSDVAGEHIEVKQGYKRQVPYLEAVDNKETTRQAIRIKQLYYDFDADYCVLDARNAGISVYDQLAKTLYDQDRNIEYKPWKCMNDKEMAERINIAGAEENVFAIKASTELNSAIAVAMRTALNDKMIDLLVNNEEGVDEIQSHIPEYASESVDMQIFYERPYQETTALVNEMIRLEYTILEQTRLVRIENTSKSHKDRYTSVSYGNYFASLLEQDLLSDNSDYEFTPLVN